MLFYLSEHHFLYTGATTDDMFSIWPDSDGKAIRLAVEKCAAMAHSGDVEPLADGHHQQIHHGAKSITPFLQAILAGDRQFRSLLWDILAAQPGLTIPQIYVCLTRRRDVPWCFRTSTWSLPMG